MYRSVVEYKAAQIASGDEDFENLHDLNRLLSRFRDTVRMSLVAYCEQKSEESRQDLQLSRKVSLTEYDLMSGSSQKALDKMRPVDYYLKDLKKMKSILAEPDSLQHTDMYRKTLSGYFKTALSKLNRKKSAETEFMEFLLLFSGNSQGFSERYEVIQAAYDKALKFLVTEPEAYVPDYCEAVLKTIKAFSANLEADEFYTIYMDMLNHTAADYLGSDLVEIGNTYARYAYVTDKQDAYDKYLATAVE